MPTKTKIRHATRQATRLHEHLTAIQKSLPDLTIDDAISMPVALLDALTHQAEHLLNTLTAIARDL